MPNSKIDGSTFKSPSLPFPITYNSLEYSLPFFSNFISDIKLPGLYIPKISFCSSYNLSTLKIIFVLKLTDFKGVKDAVTFMIKFDSISNDEGDISILPSSFFFISMVT